MFPSRAMWINGRLARGADAVVSLWDRGARDGEGLFETVRVYSGRPFQWQRHLERLVLSAAELGFPVPPSPATLERGLAELLEAEGLADAVARVTVTRGVPGGRPTRTGCWIDAEPVEGRLWRGTRRGGAIVVCSRVPFEPGSLGPHKTTSRLAYHLAREEARAARADEALLVSPEGSVLEGAASNLFVLAGGAVLTPPLSERILPGVTRAIVMRLCVELGIAVRETPIARGLLATAEEAWLTNSVQEVVPVDELEGRSLPTRRTGTRLRDRYRTLTEGVAR